MPGPVDKPLWFLTGTFLLFICVQLIALRTQRVLDALHTTWKLGRELLLLFIASLLPSFTTNYMHLHAPPSCTSCEAHTFTETLIPDSSQLQPSTDILTYGHSALKLSRES